MSTSKYICLRFFIVPLQEHLFTTPVADIQKLSWFKQAFLANRDYQMGSQEYAVRIVEPDEQDGIVFGKLSRKRVYETHPKTADDIKDVVSEDWPYLEFLCDCSVGKQLVVIEYNSTVIYKMSVVKTVLEGLVGGAMFQHGYSVQFEPIIDDESFWGLVYEAEGVYSLNFLLNSPNLFGAGSKANEALGDLRKTFNNTRVKITLENELGLLNVPKEQLETYREYADKGGGEWTITTRPKGKGRKKRKHSSSERALKVAAEKVDSQPLATRLRMIYQQFLRKLK